MSIEQKSNDNIQSLQEDVRTERIGSLFSFLMAGGLAVGSVTSVVLGPENIIIGLSSLGMAAGAGFLIHQGLDECEVVSDVNDKINELQSEPGQQR